MGPEFDPWSGNQILNAAIKTLHSQISWLIFLKNQEGIKRQIWKKKEKKIFIHFWESILRK